MFVSKTMLGTKNEPATSYFKDNHCLPLSYTHHGKTVNIPCNYSPIRLPIINSLVYSNCTPLPCVQWTFS